MDCAKLNSSRRFCYAASTFLQRNKAGTSEQVLEYSKAAHKDIEEFTNYLLPFFFLNGEVPFDYRVTIDPLDMVLDARVIKEGDNSFNINLSLGAVLAADTACCYLCRMLFPKAETVHDYTDHFRDVEPLMRDYTFIFDSNITEPPARTLLYGYPVVFSNPDIMEFFIILTNLSIFWFVAHEVGHIQLNHFSEEWRNGVNEVHESGYSQGPINRNLVKELSADSYANLKFFSTLFRSDALGAMPKLAQSKLPALSLLMFAATVPCILMHRMQLSYAGRGFANAVSHPDARIRLFNSLACVTPAIDNNARFLRPLLNHLDSSDIVLDVSLEELAFLTSNVTLMIDELLKLVNAVPLWPWPVSIERKPSYGGGYVTLANYGDLDKLGLLNARSEIVSAMLTACLGNAQFSSSTKFDQTHADWLEIVKLGRSLLVKDFPSLEDIDASSINFDMTVFQTYSLFNEINNASSYPERHLLKNIQTTEMMRGFITSVDENFSGLRA